jgi:hypothetical protein
MRKQPIVFRPTGMKMLEHLLFAGPLSTVKITRTETAQQQLGLVEPRRMCRSHQHPNLRVIALQKQLRITRSMTRTSIPNYVDAGGFAVLSKQLRQHPTQMRAVVAFQAPPAHFATMHHQRYQKVHRAMPNVFERSAFNLSWSRPARRARAPEEQASHPAQ